MHCIILDLLLIFRFLQGSLASNQFAKYDLNHVIAIGLVVKLKAEGKDKRGD